MRPSQSVLLVNVTTYGIIVCCCCVARRFSFLGRHEVVLGNKRTHTHSDHHCVVNSSLHNEQIELGDDFRENFTAKNKFQHIMMLLMGCCWHRRLSKLTDCQMEKCSDEWRKRIWNFSIGVENSRWHTFRHRPTGLTCERSTLYRVTDDLTPTARLESSTSLLLGFRCRSVYATLIWIQVKKRKTYASVAGDFVRNQ